MADLSRRYFFAGAAAAAATTRKAPAQSANRKVVLALIGAGGRGTQLANNFARVENVEFKYICEVNDERGEKVLTDLEKIRGVRPQRVLDMRRTFDDKDVDGVVIATPEHWHALATVWACQAGKDAYVEKNISLTIWEGRKMVEAARKYQRIVQCGTQNRSAPYALSAREYLASGKLGKIVHVKVFNLLQSSGPWKPQPDTPVPPGVDWNNFPGLPGRFPSTSAGAERMDKFLGLLGWPFLGRCQPSVGCRAHRHRRPAPSEVGILPGRPLYTER